MKILFRVDGGEGIGLGHIMRTLVLAKELSQNNEVKYICLKDKRYFSGIEKIISEGMEVVKIEGLNEINEIKGLEGDVIVIDKYNIGEIYLEQLRQKFKIVYFDDNAEMKFYPVDLIINQNVYGEKLKYNCLEDTKLLLGRNYTMLREEFRKNKPIKVRKNIKNVLITVGGSDDDNLTESIIKDLSDLNVNLHIIVGTAFKFKENLKKYTEPNILLYENANISEIMKKCDIAISSCGSTLYELSFLGIPTIGVIVAKNQKKCGEYMENIGAIKLSKIESIKDNVLKLNYSERMNMNTKQRAIIDGGGVFRVKNKIKIYDK